MNHWPSKDLLRAVAAIAIIITLTLPLLETKAQATSIPSSAVYGDTFSSTTARGKTLNGQTSSINRSGNIVKYQGYHNTHFRVGNLPVKNSINNGSSGVVRLSQGAASGGDSQTLVLPLTSAMKEKGYSVQVDLIPYSANIPVVRGTRLAGIILTSQANKNYWGASSSIHIGIGGNRNSLFIAQSHHHAKVELAAKNLYHFSKDNWNHFRVDVNFAKDTLTVFLNGQKVVSHILDNFYNKNKIAYVGLTGVAGKSKGKIPAAYFDNFSVSPLLPRPQAPVIQKVSRSPIGFLKQFIVGACVHFGQRKGLLNANLNLLEQAHVTSTRDDLQWRRVEKKKGTFTIPAMYDWATQASLSQGITPLWILDGPPGFYGSNKYPLTHVQKAAYTRFCKQVIQHFHGQLHLYEIWNEWSNFPRGDHATSQQYAQLLAYVVPKLKKMDPSITIIGGWRVDNWHNWLNEFLAAGGLKYLDGYSAHPYVYGRPGSGRTPEAWAVILRNLEKKLMAHNNNKPMPIYVTEVGWPTYKSLNGTSPQMQAAFLARTYLIARTMPYIKGVWWYDFQNDGWNPKARENNFGIVRSDLTPKPAYDALSAVAPVVQGQYLGRVKTANKNLWILKFRRKNGKDTWAIWWTGKGLRQVVLRNNDANNKKVIVQKVDSTPTARLWQRRPWATHRQAWAIHNEISITVGQIPQLITGNLSQAKLVKVIQRKQAFSPIARAVSVIMSNTRTFAYPVSANHPFGVVASNKRIGDWQWTWLMKKAKHRGRADLNGWFAVRYDANHLYLLADIQDNKQYSPDSGNSRMWEYDSIQIDFKAVEDKQPVPGASFTELTAALTKKGPAVYRQSAASGSEPGLMHNIKAKITRAGDHTIYHLTIPTKAVDLPKLKPGTILRFTILANDNDGAGRKGFIHWGGGVGKGPKNVSKFGVLLFAPR